MLEREVLLDMPACPGAEVIFRFEPASYTASQQFPTYIRKARLAADGTGSVLLWCNEEGDVASGWIGRYPGGEETPRFSVAPGDPISLSALLALGVDASDPQNASVLAFVEQEIEARTSGAITAAIDAGDLRVDQVVAAGEAALTAFDTEAAVALAEAAAATGSADTAAAAAIAAATTATTAAGEADTATAAAGVATAEADTARDTANAAAAEAQTQASAAESAAADALAAASAAGEAEAAALQAAASATATSPIVLAVWGLLYVADGLVAPGVRAYVARTYQTHRVRLAGAPTGSSATVELTVDGVIVATAVIPAGESDVELEAEVALAVDQLVDLNVTAIGSTYAGANLVWELVA